MTGKLGKSLAGWPPTRVDAGWARAVALFTSWIFPSVGLQEVWLRAHRDDVASQLVATRVGFRRNPQRDKTQETKGEV